MDTQDRQVSLSSSAYHIQPFTTSPLAAYVARLASRCAHSMAVLAVFMLLVNCMPQVRVRMPAICVGLRPWAMPCTSALAISGACSEMPAIPLYSGLSSDRKPSMVLIAPLGRRMKSALIFVSPDARMLM